MSIPTTPYDLARQFRNDAAKMADELAALPNSEALKSYVVICDDLPIDASKIDAALGSAIVPLRAAPRYEFSRCVNIARRVVNGRGTYGRPVQLMAAYVSAIRKLSSLADELEGKGKLSTAGR